MIISSRLHSCFHLFFDCVSAHSMSVLLMGIKDKYHGVDLKMGAGHTVSEHSRVTVVLELMELHGVRDMKNICL